MTAEGSETAASSKWGPDDELGTLNLISSASVLAALSLARTGRVVELGRMLEPGMPVSDFHGAYFANMQYTLDNAAAWHESHRGRPRNGYSAQNMRLSMSDQSGTHIDQLNHVGVRGEDGRYRLYNGLINDDIVSSFGTSRLGAESLPPIICRGVLLDVARSHGDDLPAGHAVSREDLERILDRSGQELRAGDAVVIRTGWARHWDDPATYVAGEPGLTPECATWLAGFDPLLVGADNFAVDVVPPVHEGELLPVHIELLVEHGIRLVENLDLDELSASGSVEFCFLALPLKLRGATGSPLRPVAVL